MKRHSQGSLISTVLVAVACAGIVAASVTSLISFQRKQGIRQQLKLHSISAAEAAVDYAYSYIVNDADLNGLDEANYVPPSGNSPKAFTFPDDALKFLTNSNALPSTTGDGHDAISLTNIRVSVMPRPAKQVRIYIDPKDPANQTNPNKGQWIYQETIPVVAAVTAVQGGISYTSYVEKDINYNVTNLFQHAIFYQGQLHLHRGFKVMGPVHTNGNLILNAHNNDAAIYNGIVSAGHYFYRGSITDTPPAPVTGTGSGMNAFGLVAQVSETLGGGLDKTKFTTAESGYGTGTTPPQALSAGDIPIYIDTPTAGTTKGQNIYRFCDQTTDSRTAGWKDTATSLYMGYLQDKNHDVAIINPIGSVGYNMDPSSPVSNGPYFLIEPMLPANNPLRTATTSQKTNYRYNLSANASLVLRVEYAARKADGSLVAADPNNDMTYVPMTGDAPIAQALNPSNYIVRAYSKPASMARITEPADRVAIPFPTDVIGRADYQRIENMSGSSFSAADYNYAAGTDPQPVDILGTEANITVLPDATSYSPTRVKSDDLKLGGGSSVTEPTNGTNRTLRLREEAWHRYRIESYYPVDTAAKAAAYTTTPIAGTPNIPKPALTIPDQHILPNLPTPLYVGTKLDPLPASPPTISTTAAATQAFPLYGLHDSRLGRGAHLLTLDISRLKQIMEEPLANVAAKFGAEAYAFRRAFNNGSSEWNGIVYVEFPTTTTVVGWNANEALATINRAPSTSAYVDNATNPETPNITPTPGQSYLDTFLFAYATTAETLYPLRAASTSTITRTDQIVPIARAFRTYPDTVNSQVITDPVNAILALQVVNAKQLPKVNITRFDANAGNTLPSGFTLATNAPLYLVGSWNSDGDYTTGTNVTSTDPTAYATTDTGLATDTTNPEIPSAIFCDMFTVLSPAWATQNKYPNEPAAVASLTRRQNSFPGWTKNSDSDTYRRVTWKNANERIEVSACIATGDFPVFEFFTHALEDFGTSSNGTACTPLVVKGAMVSMFTSEVQHIKQAYSRDPAKDIQVYYAGHGANCFPSPRFHQFLVNGNFPPGTPQALVPSQSNFQVLFKNDPLVIKAGF
jgi:hypothetical protein